MALAQLTRPVLGCLAVALLLRLPFLGGVLGSDEAGLLLVVRSWGPGPDALYGDYWVDRPPLLLAYFWAADLLAGADGVRLLGLAVTAVLVVSAVATGHLLGGVRGAWWAGMAGAVTGSSYVIAAHQMNGMVQGVALTTASCALTVAATRGQPGARRLYGLAAGAGAVGAAAVLVKQNLVCGLAFGAVVLLASRLTGELSPRRTGLALLAGVSGAAATVGGTVLWALAAGVDVTAMWFALYEFRTLALEVISDGRPPGLPRRFDSLTASFVVSGLAPGVVLLVASVRVLAREPAARRYLAGSVAVAAVGLAGILLGGSWWRHYLVQLVPAAVLLAALLAPRAGGWGRAARGVVAVMAASAVLGALGGATAGPTDEAGVGRYLGRAAQPADTGIVAWGHAEVLLYAGLTSPYRHLWSLPTRTLDPELDELLAVMEGDRPPTWVVRWLAFGSGGLDDDGRLAAVVEDRYRLVGEPCGRAVYLLRGVDRSLPESTPC